MSNRLLAKLHLAERSCANCKHFRPDLGHEVILSNPVFHQMTTAFTPDRLASLQAEAAQRAAMSPAEPATDEDGLETLARVVSDVHRMGKLEVETALPGPQLTGEKWVNLGVCMKHTEGVFPSYSCEDWT